MLDLGCWLISCAVAHLANIQHPNSCLRGFLDLAVANAGRAHADPLVGAFDNSPNRLQVQIPTPLADIVGVTDFVAELRTPAAHIANSCHYGNLLKRLSCYCNKRRGRPANPVPAVS